MSNMFSIMCFLGYLITKYFDEQLWTFSITIPWNHIAICWYDILPFTTNTCPHPTSDLSLKNVTTYWRSSLQRGLFWLLLNKSVCILIHEIYRLSELRQLPLTRAFMYKVKISKYFTISKSKIPSWYGYFSHEETKPLKM